MVKLDTQSVPSAFETLYGKNLVNREIREIENAGRKPFQDSRKILKQIDDQSLIYAAADAWKAMSDVQRVLWNDAAENRVGERYGYNLFVEDFCYRQQVGKSPTDQINSFHQLCGFRQTKIDSPNSSIMYRYFHDIIGEGQVKFSFKFTELETPWTPRFTVQVYESWDGGHDYTTFTHEGSDIDWNEVTLDFGAVGRESWLNTLTIAIYGGYAESWIDNIIYSDSTGELFRESFELPRVGFGMSHFERKPYNEVVYSGYSNEHWLFYGDYVEEQMDCVYLDP